MRFSGTVTPAEIVYMLQILPCVNFVDKSPNENPKQSHLLLHILYTALSNSRHKWTALDPNPGTPAADRPAVPSAPLATNHGTSAPQTASQRSEQLRRGRASEETMEPAGDTVCNSSPSLSTAPSTKHRDRSWLADAREGGHVKEDAASDAPAGAFKSSSDDE